MPHFVSATISLCLQGGKPVIYLLPSSPLPNVSVQLSLIPQWEFSAIYPVVPATSSADQQSVAWKVSAEPGGMLINAEDQQSTPYLYWEAETTGKSAAGQLPFDPSQPSLTPDNSILFTLADVIPYLQKTLEQLSLGVQARTDFITYWLPSLNKHKYIALRFLPQQEYETAAPMIVEPKPDVVTRVFMLFKGIKEDDSGAWEQEKSLDWKDIVGVTAAAEDEKIFRVLECELANFASFSLADDYPRRGRYGSYDLVETCHLGSRMPALSHFFKGCSEQTCDSQFKADASDCCVDARQERQRRWESTVDSKPYRKNISIRQLKSEGKFGKKPLRYQVST